jgi:hypothetical protein
MDIYTKRKEGERKQKNARGGGKTLVIETTEDLAVLRGLWMR